MRLKKITLLRPNMGNFRATDAFPPLAMGILAARTPRDIEVSFYDDRVEPTPLNEDADLVAISVETFTAKRAYAIAATYRERGIPVVMGGHHPTLVPQEVLEHADAIILGDAEGAWEQLIEDARAGTLKREYRCDRGHTADEYKMDRHIFMGKKYAPAHLIQFGRGCRHCCDFCSVHSFYGDRQWHHPVEAILSEIRAMAAQNPARLLMFADDNLYSSREALVELLEAIAPLKIRWACQISIDVARDEQLMDLMAQSGCRIVLIGFETLNNDNLNLMKKSWNHSAGEYLEVVHAFHKRGIGICGTFVFGYDHDSAETINSTVEFVKRARLGMAQLSPLTPIPGTPFYERLKREGRLLRPEWWIAPGYRYGDPIITPLGMDVEEFDRLCFDAKKRLYAWNVIARRVFLSPTGFNLWNMGVTALSNVISRREVYRKQYRPVGV